MKELLCILSVGVTLCLSSPSAGYCIANPTSNSGSLNRFATGQSRNNDPIPVYLVTAGSASVLDDAAKVYTSGTGVTQTVLERAVQGVCRDFSEGPSKLKLYYAGTRSNNSPVEGIIIQSQDTERSPRFS